MVPICFLDMAEKFGLAADWCPCGSKEGRLCKFLQLVDFQLVGSLFLTSNENAIFYHWLISLYFYKYCSFFDLLITTALV